ncbi:head completion adaptor [Vibrio phage 1.293.O._10N.261.52.E1]|nr:head completion adaptor [Vibrio phage 1.293.O._10N.261.52.E1]
MAQVTLLDVVQRYLNATSGFYANSIGDTEESEQVALVAQEVYERLLEDLPHRQFKRKWGQLDSVADATKPNYLQIYREVHRISESEIYYNVADENSTSTINYQRMEYLEPQEFMNRINRNSDINESTEIIEDFSGLKYVIHNDRHPSFCTSFDGVYVVFDSYRKQMDDTLMSSKSQVCYMAAEPFLLRDDFVIPLPSDMIQGYIDMVKAEASETIRQEALPSAARRARQFAMSERFKGGKIGNQTGRNRPYGRKKQGSRKTKYSRG